MGPKMYTATHRFGYRMKAMGPQNIKDHARIQLSKSNSLQMWRDASLKTTKLLLLEEEQGQQQQHQHGHHFKITHIRVTSLYFTISN
jgi:hypothetical protein